MKPSDRSNSAGPTLVHQAVFLPCAGPWPSSVKYLPITALICLFAAKSLRSGVAAIRRLLALSLFFQKLDLAKNRSPHCAANCSSRIRTLSSPTSRAYLTTPPRKSGNPVPSTMATSKSDSIAGDPFLQDAKRLADHPQDQPLGDFLPADLARLAAPFPPAPRRRRRPSRRWPAACGCRPRSGTRPGPVFCPRCPRCTRRTAMGDIGPW